MKQQLSRYQADVCQELIIESLIGQALNFQEQDVSVSRIPILRFSLMVWFWEFLESKNNKREKYENKDDSPETD